MSAGAIPGLAEQISAAETQRALRGIGASPPATLGDELYRPDPGWNYGTIAPFKTQTDATGNITAMRPAWPAAITDLYNSAILGSTPIPSNPGGGVDPASAFMTTMALTGLGNAPAGALSAGGRAAASSGAVADTLGTITKDFTNKDGSPIFFAPSKEGNVNVLSYGSAEAGNRFRWVDTPNGPKILSANLGPELQGQGIAAQFYRDLAANAAKAGKPLSSDSAVSPQAFDLYKMLETQGYKLNVNPKARFDGRNWTTGSSGEPVVSVTWGGI